jgi:hypothetical protein
VCVYTSSSVAWIRRVVRQWDRFLSNSYLIRRRFQVGLQVPATILTIIGERIGRGVIDHEQRSYFVTCFAFVRLILGFAPLLLKLGVCCKSLI